MQFARVYYSPGSLPTRVKAADLYFAGTRALLVVKWKRRNGERVPDQCIELDPSRLKCASSNGTIYRYEGSIEG